jgi:hypothetical protein
MNAIIIYDMIMSLLANPPSLDPRPNSFNLCALRTQLARALKKVPCPQSAVNGWVGAVLAPAMYALIDTNPFNWNINPRTAVPDFLARFATLPNGTQGAALPYLREEVENKMVLFGSKFWIPEQFRTLTIAVLGPIATETRRHPFSIPAAPFICNHVSLASCLIVVSTAHLYATAFFCMQQTHPFLDPQPAIHLHPCVLSLLI